MFIGLTVLLYLTGRSNVMSHIKQSKKQQEETEYQCTCLQWMSEYYFDGYIITYRRLTQQVDSQWKIGDQAKAWEALW